jgi:hypothetical protein
MVKENNKITGIPFFVMGYVGKNGNVRLWDGKHIYDNQGEGFASDYLSPVRYGMTMTTFKKEFDGQLWHDHSHTKENKVI